MAPVRASGASRQVRGQRGSGLICDVLGGVKVSVAGSEQGTFGYTHTHPTHTHTHTHVHTFRSSTPPPLHHCPLRRHATPAAIAGLAPRRFLSLRPKPDNVNSPHALALYNGRSHVRTCPPAPCPPAPCPLPF